MKNQQFNYFIQFRSISGSKNDHDFTRNSKKISFSRNVYQIEKNPNKPDQLTVTLKYNHFKFQENKRNKYRYIELLLHLCVLIAFWLGVDLITLPASLVRAWPAFKFFTLYSLYYLVISLIFLFELWFAFVRFLKFKND